MRYVPHKPRKPFWGNLALAIALTTVNAFRATCFLVYWALNR